MDDAQQKAVYVDEETQTMLNAPQQKSGGMNVEDLKFMNLVISLINEGKINAYVPSSLINEEFYKTLPEEKQGRADMEAVNLLSSIRQINDLKDAGFVETYQMENLVAQVRATKERIEQEGGDLFII